jgi:SagB-type dehydrogenase family enzyme
MDSLRIITGALALLTAVLLSCPSSGQDQRSAEAADDAAAAPGTIELPAPLLTGDMPLEETLAARRSLRSYSDEALSLADAAQLLWAAQGITWPERGFRTAPSAGALFPLEVYLAAGSVDGLEPGLYHYLPHDHQLQPVAAGDVRPALRDVAVGQAMLTDAPAVLCLTGVVKRTSGKYGERAEGYMLIEVGHAGQNICLQAVALGLGAVTIGAFIDADLAELLRLPAGEEPLYLIPVGHPAV